MGTAQLGAELDDAEIRAVAAFLRTLTRELPEIAYPNLPPSTGATPRPFLKI